MSQILGTRTWILWWAALTAAALLKTWVRLTAAFFRDSALFTPAGFPFNLATGINGWLQGISDWIMREVKFNPGAPLANAGGVVVPNVTFAFLVGALLLAGAIALYLRAVSSARLTDDLLTLLLLYFVLRVEAHILAISQVANLSTYGRTLVENTAFTFYLLLVVLFGAFVVDKRMRTVRGFWRAVVEMLILGIFLLPKEAAGAVGAGLDLVAQFGDLLQANVGWAFLWGILGLVLAGTRLYRADAPTKSA